MLDLRYLNEKVAGEHGFIRLSPDGNSFVRGDGQPIRFWAASLGFRPELDLAAQKHDAQFLAKRGVNFVRVLGDNSLIPTAEGSKITDVNEKALDEIFKSVAAMKSAGIYSMINPLLGLPGEDPEELGRDRPRQRLSPKGCCSSSRRCRRASRRGSRRFTRRKNPYTGLTLAEDPAVAIIEIAERGQPALVGLLQHQGRRADHVAALVRRFSEARSTARWRRPAQAWQNSPGLVPDAWDKGLPGLMHAWDLTRDARVKKGKIPGFEQRSGRPDRVPRPG